MASTFTMLEAVVYGEPSGACLTNGALPTVGKVSRLSTLCGAEAAPRPSTATSSRRTLSPVKIDAPSLMASSDTRTATTVVTPTIVTSDEPRRWPMLRSPVAVSANVCLRKLMEFS